MYTADILGKSLSRESEIITVTVRFTEDENSFDKDFKFGAEFTEDDLKRRIKRAIDDLEASQLKVEAIPEGKIDLTGVVLNPQTQEQIDEAKWFRQLNRLRTFQELKALGGMPPAWQTDLDTLAAKVQNDARKAYLNNL